MTTKQRESALDRDVPERESLPRAMERLGVSVRSEFVPFSRSRNAKPNAKVSDRSLNWRVTVVRDGRDILTTDYQAGIGHCPSYKQKMGGGFTLDEAEAIIFETEHGKTARWMGGGLGLTGKEKIELEAADVVHCLVADASVLDSPTFEDWASEYGYDTDSRSAEATYRACLEIALKLRSGLGESTLSELRDAAQDY